MIPFLFDVFLKRLIPLIGGFFLFVSLYGCGEPSDNVKTLRFVTWKPNQPEVWETVLKIFEAENAGVVVKREIGPHSSTAFHDLLTQKLKNKSKDVDVFFMDVVWPPEFAAAGWAEPLDSYFTVQEQQAFLDGPILANKFEGEIYGVPLFIDSGVLYYRTDLLAKYDIFPPETWEDLVNAATTIVEKEKEIGNELVGYSGQFKQYEGLVCDMLEVILSNGGDILDSSQKSSMLSDPKSIEPVRFVRDHIIGVVAPRGVLTYQEPESLDLFVQGKAVFHRNWPYAWEVSNDPEKSRIAGKVGITRLPHFPGGRSFSTLGGWQLGISRTSTNKDTAWKFVKFITSSRVQKIFATQAGKAPTRLNLYDDPEVLAANPHFAQMRAVFQTAYPRPRSPLYPAISNILQRYFSKAISSPASDIEKEAKTASMEIDQLLSLTADSS